MASRPAPEASEETAIEQGEAQAHAVPGQPEPGAEGAEHAHGPAQMR